MYNLLLSLALGLVSGLLSGILVGQAIAGVIPGVLLAVVAYIVLARRTGQQLQAIVNEAMAEFQGMDNIAPPRTPAEAQRLRNLQLSKIAAGKEILRRGFALGPWQFLVSKQIHAQIGAIDYMQMDWGEARTSLEQAWSRNWQAKAMLAVRPPRAHAMRSPSSKGPSSSPRRTPCSGTVRYAAKGASVTRPSASRTKGSPTAPAPRP